MGFQYSRVDQKLIDEENKITPVKFTFGDHQIRAINYFLSNPKAMMVMSTGVGKSLTVISTFFAQIKKGILDKAMICCTLASIGEVENDCKKFYGYRPKYVGNFKELKEWLKMPNFPIALIRYEWLKKICADNEKETMYKVMSSKKVGVAFDEAQRIKNAGYGNLNEASQTFYYSYKLTRGATAIIPMTATPIYSGLDDMWSIMFCTDKQVLGTYEEFVDKYYVTEWAPLAFYNTSKYRCKVCGRPMEYKNINGQGYMVCTHPAGCMVVNDTHGNQTRKHYMWRIKHERRIVSVKNMHLLSQTLINSMFCFFPEQDIRFHEVSVKLNDATWNKYYEIVTDTVKYKLTPDQVDKPDDPTPWSTRQLWLQYAIDSSPEKLLSLVSLVRQNLHKGVVVYCYFHESVEAVAKEFDLFGIQYKMYTGRQNKKERDAAKEWFTSDSTNKVLIISQAGGASLNLQTTDTFIFYSTPYSCGEMLQAMGRIVRLYSKYKTFHINFVNAYDTIDVYKSAWLVSHKKVLDDLFNNKIIPDAVPDLELSNALRKYLRDKYVWHKEYTQTLQGGFALRSDVAS